MTPAQLYETCLRLTKLMADKGYIRPKVIIYVNWLYDEKLTANIEYRATDSGKLQNKFIHSNTFEGWSVLIEATEKVIDALPSIADAQRNNFIVAVGKLIDQGREIGIEVDFINPLTEMMKSLSTNIITN